MGCFDTFVFLSDAPKCAHGHEMKSLQTKDLGEMMRAIYIFGGQAFGGPNLGPVARTARIVGGVLEQSGDMERYAHDNSLDGEVAAYSGCALCDPVCTFNPDAHYDGGVIQHQPWCEWLIRFEHGYVVAITPVRVQSRDDVRRDIAARIGELLPDDDRIVKRILEKHRKEVDHG